MTLGDLNSTPGEPEETEASKHYLSQMCRVSPSFLFFPSFHRELSWSYRKTTCPLRLSEDALRNKRRRLGKSLHKWGLGLKESKLQERRGAADLYQVKRICSLTLLHFPGTETAQYTLLVLSRHTYCHLLHYGNYNFPSNLLYLTKKCLFKIPWSIIKTAIELQNTIITTRLGGALVH